MSWYKLKSIGNRTPPEGVEWAFACDFVNQDTGSAQVPQGTCWMKSGSVQKSDAQFNNNDQIICGLMVKSALRHAMPYRFGR